MNLTKINFKINNKLVDNNYVIKEEGVYVIELIGNNETSVYTIEVKKIKKQIFIFIGLYSII